MTDRQTDRRIDHNTKRLEKKSRLLSAEILYRCSRWLYITAMLLWTQLVCFSLWSNNNVLSLKLFFTQIQSWFNCFVMKSMTWMFCLFFLRKQMTALHSHSRPLSYPLCQQSSGDHTSCFPRTRPAVTSWPGLPVWFCFFLKSWKCPGCHCFSWKK